MAGTFSDYLEGEFLKAAVGKVAFDKTAGLYLALATAAVSDTTTGTTLTEPNTTTEYVGYTRLAITGAEFGNPSGTGNGVATITNTSALTFAECTGGSGAAIVAVVCVDAATNGNILWWSSITSKTIDTANTPPTIAAGALTITLD